MVKIKNIMKSFTCIMFFVLYFGHNGQRHFWSKSFEVLLNNGYKKREANLISRSGLPPLTYS